MLPVPSDHAADREDPFVGGAGDDDALAAVAGVDDLSVADVQADVAAVADEIARLRVGEAADIGT